MVLSFQEISISVNNIVSVLILCEGIATRNAIQEKLPFDESFRDSMRRF
jgi:hypothetical protein